MQDRAEDLAVEFGDVVQPDQGRGDECPARQGRRNGELVEHPGPHALDVGVDAPLGLDVDHRPDVGGRIGRIADDQLVHRPAQHVEDRRGDVLVQAQQAQGRAALAGGEEGRGDDVGDHLFGQGGGVHQHGVETAGLGDQGDERARLVFEQGAGDAPGAGGRAGEGDAGHARVGDQGRADLGPAGDQLQHLAGNAGLEGQAHGVGGDQRRLRRRLGDHRVSGRQRGGDLAQEDGQREVPRADAGEHPAPGQRAAR